MFFSDFGLRHIPEWGRSGYSVLSDDKARFRAASTSGWKPLDAKMDLPFDVFSLACLLCYTLTKGYHPFGDTLKVRISRIEKNCLALTPQRLVDVVEDAAGVFKMLQTMLNVKSELRPTVKQLLTHPLFNRPLPTVMNSRIWNFEGNCYRVKLFVL